MCSVRTQWLIGGHEPLADPPKPVADRFYYRTFPHSATTLEYADQEGGEVVSCDRIISNCECKTTQGVAVMDEYMYTRGLSHQIHFLILHVKEHAAFADADTFVDWGMLHEAV